MLINNLDTIHYTQTFNTKNLMLKLTMVYTIK